MKNMLKRLDELFCTYIGLDQQIVTLNSIQLRDNHTSVSTTESYKRHTHTSKWDSFSENSFQELNPQKKQNLGVAIGKSLAKNLFVSFEEISIRKDTVDVK